MSQEKFRQLQHDLGVKFQDLNLLTNAFIHRSYLNEDPTLNLPSNERLEFLGDACLELAISEYLFKTYPLRSEGDLTSYRSAVVNTLSLAETASKLNLGEYLLMSKGEEASGGRSSIHLLANTFEALLGTIYLEAGYEKTKEVVYKLLVPKIEPMIKNQTYKDAKSKLQEVAQDTVNITPHYEVLEDWGPDHDKIFKVGVFVGKKMIGVGEGTSKQRAEINAAEDALENWRYK